MDVQGLNTAIARNWARCNGVTSATPSGSTATARLRFTTVGVPVGVGIRLDDSATLGTRWLIDQAGLYYVELTLTKVAGATRIAVGIGKNASGTANPVVGASGIYDAADIIGVADEVPEVKVAALIDVTPEDILLPGDVEIAGYATNGAGAAAANLITAVSARMAVTCLGRLT